MKAPICADLQLITKCDMHTAITFFCIEPEGNGNCMHDRQAAGFANTAFTFSFVQPERKGNWRKTTHGECLVILPILASTFAHKPCRPELKISVLD